MNLMFELFVLHKLVSLAAVVNQMYVIHEAMNGVKNLKIHYRLDLKKCKFHFSEKRKM